MVPSLNLRLIMHLCKRRAEIYLLGDWWSLCEKFFKWFKLFLEIINLIGYIFCMSSNFECRWEVLLRWHLQFTVNIIKLVPLAKHLFLGNFFRWGYLRLHHGTVTRNGLPSWLLHIIHWFLRLKLLLHALLLKWLPSTFPLVIRYYKFFHFVLKFRVLLNVLMR